MQRRAGQVGAVLSMMAAVHATSCDGTARTTSVREDASPKYELLGRLGAGGMATVHLARSSEAAGRKLVAIKRPHDFVAEDPSRLREEARIGSSIKHPNVVGIVELLESDPPALVMECIPGMDLATLSHVLSAANKRLPMDVAVAIVADLLAGLDAAHEARGADGTSLEVVHRDVSPHNVLIGFDGRARLADFGVASAVGQDATTSELAIQGKLGYMAPEQLDGRFDRRSDVYSAGVVLWELLSGRRLRTTGGTGPQILIQVLQGIAEAPSVYAPDAAPLDDVVHKALKRSPADRFTTAREMQQMLGSRVVPASAERVAEVVASVSTPAEWACQTGGSTERTSRATPSHPAARRRRTTAPRGRGWRPSRVRADVPWKCLRGLEGGGTAKGEAHGGTADARNGPLRRQW